MKFLSIIFFSLAACGQRIPLPVDTCEPACRSLHAMGCEEAENVEDCTAFCVDTMRGGYDLRLGCAFGATTCEDFRACTER
jgi:hypothetical protein